MHLPHDARPPPTASPMLSGESPLRSSWSHTSLGTIRTSHDSPFGLAPPPTASPMTSGDSPLRRSWSHASLGLHSPSSSSFTARFGDSSKEFGARKFGETHSSGSHFSWGYELGHGGGIVHGPIRPANLLKRHDLPHALHRAGNSYPEALASLTAASGRRTVPAPPQPLYTDIASSARPMLAHLRT